MNNNIEIIRMIVEISDTFKEAVEYMNKNFLKEYTEVEDVVDSCIEGIKAIQKHLNYIEIIDIEIEILNERLLKFFYKIRRELLNGNFEIAYGKLKSGIIPTFEEWKSQIDSKLKKLMFS